MRSVRPIDAAELLALAALWGGAFLFMRMGAGQFGPVALVAVRVTGAALFLMLWFLLWLLEMSLSGEEGYARAKDIASGFLVKLVLLGLLWSFLHHLCAGIRHLFLDMHKGVDLPPARMTSVVVFVVSIALTIAIGAALIW